MALGEQETAGINLTWLRDNLLYHQDELLQEDKVPDVYKIFDKMVSQTKPGEKKIIFTPWMFGERSPVENHTIRAGLYNISLDCNRRHLIRAVFEGVAFNSKWLLKYLEKLIGQKLDPITIIGGGALSDVWMQIYSDILDREVKQLARAKEGNSIGAALIASEALGLTTWEEIPTLINIEKKFKPRKEFREYYDNMFKEFVKIYKNNRKMYSRLNKR